MAQFTIYLTPKQREQVHDLAERYEQSQSRLVNAILTVFLEEAETDPDTVPRVLARYYRLSPL